MMRAAVWLVAAMLGLGAGLVATAGGASSPQQAGSAQAAAPAKAGDDPAWGEPTDEPVQAGQTPPATTPEQAGDAPAAEPNNAPKKDADGRSDKSVPAGQPTPPPTPEQAGSAPGTEREKAGSTPATEPEQAKQPALTLPAGTPEQQQLEKDTSRLLQLVQELKVEVEKAGKDTLSLAAIRKADEIQKLTKDLKERMRERGQVPGNRP
jgi:hypothetical protein